MTDVSSAASCMCCEVAVVGRIVRRSTARTRRSTIASLAGLSEALGAIVPGACRARSIDRHPDDRLDAHQDASLSRGRKGGKKQAIGRSRGGRNTKIHALADAKGRFFAILLTGGQAHDCPVAERLIRTS